MGFSALVADFSQFKYLCGVVCHGIQAARRFEMNFSLMALLTCVTAVTFVTGNLIPVRLVGGPSEMEGIVEVYYNNEWGSVCDDEINDSGCAVVCSQLDFSGGVLVKKAPEVYGEGTGQIWLDDVSCTGQEPDLNNCQHQFWGKHDCEHSEDIGCKCDPAAVFTDQLPGTCDTARHRINAFDQDYLGIGRVEVQDDLGQWHTICDDYWDDVDAAVFCQCLGYTEPSHFRAYWNPQIIKMQPSLDTVYDAVHCSVTDMDMVQNIWACETGISSGNCDSATEAAAVACEAVPSYTPPETPETSVDCDGNILSVCFTNDDYALDKQYMEVSPTCVTASPYDVTDGICVDIPLHDCDAEESTDTTAKHYCFDVSYVEPSQVTPLITSNMWGRSACCSLAKNGSVLANFNPIVEEQAAVYTDTSVNFTVQCYLDDTFEGEPLELPVNISRGQDLFCKVSAATYDPSIQLIVPNCKFMPVTSGTPSYQFLDDKCPTSEEFGLNYYSFNGHNWGFNFHTPKFQGYDSLYIECDCYVCDPTLDSKPYCDRSCRDPARKKRSAENHNSYSSSSSLIVNGPFHILDSNHGPLLSSTGELLNSISYETVYGASTELKPMIFLIFCLISLIFIV